MSSTIFGADRAVAEMLRAVTRSSPHLLRNTLGRRAATLTRRNVLPAPRVNTFSAVTRSFSSSHRRQGGGTSDESLIAKLESEIEFETSNTEALATEPEFLKTFKQQGVWKIEDKSGQDEVTLTRSFGNESIKLLFSIADLDNQANEDGMEDESATAETDEEGNDLEEPGFPVRTSITINKPEGGALTIDAIAQDGVFVIDNIAFYSDALLASELTAEADWKRRGLYIGPQFSHLDESLQQEFEDYLEERGVDASLALFIPELADYKEQREYYRWLKKVKTFVEA
ncbi:uncharacterized protein L969DRAFT_19728 [Mixia osmundae IAM 14324]|uniref:Mitochondrial glyco protein n=1 Tax=Mixia osmundae (strain CBS 9802 / IAM 14324 / JCM 22182 / KY 12970) TaxID=764103 RepID=G7DZM1_MIXOS|nr:uncharacterized protein L969DRAFT_19728 [Mixia osmundae IAM 14324]KEI37193.1 hypothetical protein L969DRAFT_19728 [Mixia osmundae IAM 14324]GAA96031.1 hypothetical protein E5Q_02691 [Mixia osmundae IAM 14324]